MRWRSFLVVLLLAVPSAVIIFSQGEFVAADTSTPTLTPIPVAVTPELTPVPATPEINPTVLPTVAQESSTPLATAAPVYVEPTLTPTSVARPETTSGITPLLPTSIPVAAPTALPAPAPVQAPLPSPAQLRLDARLRWGKGVPAAVRRWAFLIVPAAREYNLNPNLLAAVMTMESGGDPLAWSGADARGLMQILHGPWDPRQNVFRGAEMLAGFYAEFHDWKLALAAYNAGPGAVIQYGGVPPFRETRDYVIIVSFLYDLFDHRKLTDHRKSVYRSTLKDLQHFAEQRKKVKRLAQVADVPAPVGSLCRRFSETCNQNVSENVSQNVFQTPDPFWPLSDVPDPLTQVNPYADVHP